MDAILKVGSACHSLGPRNVLDSFFETVACRMEPGGRATRFPIVSDHLKSGRMPKGYASGAVQELKAISSELRALPAGKILWMEGAKPNGAGNAYQALCASDGKPLVEHFLQGAEQSAAFGKTMSISSPEQVRGEQWGMFSVLLGGVAWSVIGYVFLRRWLLTSIHADNAKPEGLPIWTIGLLIAAFGFLGLVGATVPALKMWFTRRTWAFVIGFLFVILGWMALVFVH